MNINLRALFIPRVMFLYSLMIDIFHGWLEPMLTRIANDRSVIAVPRTHSIGLNNMDIFWPGEVIFGFNYNLMFTG